ncbi:STAS domain-containing protein [Streptomyces sp. BR123]|uniref:STAS domain-containing protein n=1 Tax=Streptomyces sp. BR123 TaxID=2749828 RepID=UPI0015C49206|nr:STAS domain-containing protein [Streptomyces sp. BR123]NXY94727.1 STAS domain-containing protein [Streptomyces sp. BR123]
MHSRSGKASPGIEVDTRGDRAVVRPYGEMDVARAEAFRQAVFEALAGEPRVTDVVVDLQHLAFCDSSGLNVLLNARTAVAATGQNLYLAAPREQFLRLLELTGSQDLFTIEPAPPF